MKLSIIVVCLNAGDELKATVKSIITQSFDDYEIIVKDGGSTDSSLDKLPEDSHIKSVSRKDTGIYDAMNQALECAEGEYVYFLNCGDYLYDENVLEKIVSVMNETERDAESSLTNESERSVTPVVIYGNIFDRIGNTVIASNPNMDEFACYRNVPCHQACFYNRKMLLMHPFETEYKVRADYEQFLWCFFIAKARMIYTDIVVSSYMGGGYSETKESRKRSANEHRTIVENYMPHSHVVKYRWRMRLSMAGLRGVIARNPLTATFYNKLKARIYNK